MAPLVVLNNWLHDFSAAGWIFGTVLLWYLARSEIPAGDAGKIIAGMLKKVLMMTRLCLGGIVFFGAFRAVAYKQYEWNAAAGEDQMTVLMIKHVVLAAIVAAGLVLYIKAGNVLKQRL
ncbi:hypothetical protein ACFL43_06545 [Thermodesulfobacteriota bacterium]